MIEINLLPEEMRKKEPKFKAIDIDMSKFNVRELPLVKIAIASGAALVVIYLILLAIGAYVQAELTTLNKRHEGLIPQKREADSLKVEVDTINRKMAAIDELMVKRFVWAKKLDDLGDAITPGVWLTELSYNEIVVDRAVPGAVKSKGQKELAKAGSEKALARHLTMAGYAVGIGEEGTALVGKFIKSLKENADFYGDFNDIELGSIKRDRIGDQEVMSFRITCLFKEAK